MYAEMSVANIGYVLYVEWQPRDTNIADNAKSLRILVSEKSMNKLF